MNRHEVPYYTSFRYTGSRHTLRPVYRASVRDEQLTLADRIAKGPIPLDEALPIAKQIAGHGRPRTKPA